MPSLVTTLVALIAAIQVSSVAESRVGGGDLDRTGISRPAASLTACTPSGSAYTYGETASDPSSQYNGRVYDPGTGFHDYGARMYWPQIGRFISADSYMGDIANPASLNRYSYVHNNPYKYVDPSGHDVELFVRDSGNASGRGSVTNFGHTALRVHGEGYDLTYDFGRYGAVGSDKTTGEGILREWTDWGAFLEAEKGFGDYRTVNYDTSAQTDQAIMSWFAAKTNEGEPANARGPSLVGKAFKLKDDYSLFSNNCTTLSLGALKEAEKSQGEKFPGLDMIGQFSAPIPLYRAIPRMKDVVREQSGVDLGGK